MPKAIFEEQKKDLLSTEVNSTIFLTVADLQGIDTFTIVVNGVKFTFPSN